ncbi:MAG: UDP-glucose--hexose-1-phosphate uridylyltransferase [Anaerolinea sp.]|nr:UDP-glucose--hexose-1-phosphate uridylyltransferase [Anaerolinea sp.]MCC6976390.1 UDP-glucose--hexose-1-phosphate uridylyltransferase [Anaerolineae bacterium]
MTLILSDHPHRRYNPLTREWVLVSPHRTKRPWQGQVEKPPAETRPKYDPKCYLCPGNVRANGEHNPQYPGTFVFDNDFPALLRDTPAEEYNPHPLLRAQGERGIARVVCFSPHHDLTLAQMESADIRTVVDTWAEQYLDLGSVPYVGYVQIFENRGEMMGASNPHPHGQIWASERLPQQAVLEDAAQRDYFAEHGRSLLEDYAAVEIKAQERLIYENEAFVVVVPFWAVWPFETLLISKRHVSAVCDLESAERDALADALHHLTVRYDNIFETSFPYSMGLHQRPTLEGDWAHWHFHAHFYPPLLRSASVRKFLVGYEMLGTPQRDITAEQAAARIREQSAVHYSKRDSKQS